MPLSKDIARLFRYIAQIFDNVEKDKKPDEPEEPPEEPPKIEDPPWKDPKPTKKEIDHFDNPKVDICLYTSSKLDDRNDRAGEWSCATFIANALSDARYNYKIRYGFETVDPPLENARKETPRWWKNQELPHTGDHSNMLLVDAFGNGGTFGDRSVVGMQNIVKNMDFVRLGEGKEIMNLHNCIHELGWNLGIPADEDPHKEGKQHAGQGWNEAEKWHRTPMVMGNDVENACGEYIEKREYNRTVHHTLFCECAKSFIDIE